jgi:hypothetical protein
MKRLFITILTVLPAFSEAQEKTETIIYDSFGIVTKSIVTTKTGPAIKELNGVTFGIGMGWSYMFNKPKDYFLTPDSFHLQSQELSHSGIVLSSVISIKLGKVAEQDGKLINYKDVDHMTNLIKSGEAKLSLWERLAVNISLNLAAIDNGDITFNTSIDGGIGIGIYFTKAVQAGLFYDMLRVRQMRDYFVETYEGKPIPNGNDNGVINALDQNNNNLFYNKYYSGISLKVIFSVGNKKDD